MLRLPFIRLRPQRGFTLLEALVSVVITGVLASAAIVGYQKVQERGYRAQMLGGLTQYAQAQDEFYSAQQKRYYGDVSEIEGATIFRLSEALEVREEESSALHYRLRLGHPKTQTVCEIDYLRGAPVEAREARCYDASTPAPPPPPTATTLSLSATPHPALVGEAVALSSGLSGDQVNLLWGFGDGSPKSRTRVGYAEHRWAASGIYPVSASSATQLGQADVVVIERPELYWGVGAASLWAGADTTLVLKLTNRSALPRSFRLEGASSAGLTVVPGAAPVSLSPQTPENVTLRLSAAASATPGSRTVRVVAYDSERREAEGVVDVRVDVRARLRPVAKVSCPATVVAGERFSCTLTGSDPTNYFGPVSTEWASPKDTVGTAVGEMLVIGTVRNRVGDVSAPDTARVQVTNRDPSATLLCPLDVLVGQPVTCLPGGSDPDGHAVSFRLDWDDGSVQTSEPWTHEYLAEGRKTVRLEASDPYGGVGRASADIIVRPRGGPGDGTPVARWKLVSYGDTVPARKWIDFDATASTSGIANDPSLTYIWSGFGGEKARSTTPDFRQAYGEPIQKGATYPTYLCLKVKNSAGAESAESCRSFTVEEMTYPRFSWTYRGWWIDNGFDISFFNTSKDYGIGQWVIDVTRSEGTVPIKRYWAEAEVTWDRAHDVDWVDGGRPQLRWPYQGNVVDLGRVKPVAPHDARGSWDRTWRPDQPQLDAWALPGSYTNGWSYLGEHEGGTLRRGDGTMGQAYLGFHQQYARHCPDVCRGEYVQMHPKSTKFTVYIEDMRGNVRQETAHHSHTDWREGGSAGRSGSSVSRPTASMTAELVEGEEGKWPQRWRFRGSGDSEYGRIVEQGFYLTLTDALVSQPMSSYAGGMDSYEITIYECQNLEISFSVKDDLGVSASSWMEAVTGLDFRNWNSCTGSDDDNILPPVRPY
jgi:prepilin-type N-terminal cleavage/methylation domain-containing protein